MHPRDYIVKFCDELKEKLLAKFDRGAVEHGSDISGLDYDKEISQEIMDLINFVCMEKFIKEINNGTAK